MKQKIVILSILFSLLNNSGFGQVEKDFDDLLYSKSNTGTPLSTGDVITIIQQPLANIPTIITPGDTLEILCDLQNQPYSWTAKLIYKNRVIELRSLDQIFDSLKNLWLLTAIIPDTVLFELYDLKLEIPGNDTDVVKNAVHIIPNFKSDFYFVHITDTHLPTHLYYFQGGSENDTSELEDLRQVIKDINLINPAFVLITGDIINEGELEDYLDRRYYTRTQKILSEFEVPVYLVAGNHDIGGWILTPMPDGTARRDWWRFFGWNYLDIPPVTNQQYTQDYTFDYGKCHFIGMESYINYDSWRSEIYGSASFTNGQLTWLQNNLNNSDLSSLNILFYHYDFNNQIDLNALGVDLALWGHTHRDEGSIYDYPFNLGTQACCDGNRAYRLIRIQEDKIIPTNTLWAGSTGNDLYIHYIDNNPDPIAAKAVITNRIHERFEDSLVKLQMEPGKIAKIENGAIFQIDSVSSPWSAYVHTNIPPFSNYQVIIYYQMDISKQMIFPQITSIVDVPNDQGKQVSISWRKSLKDDVDITDSLVTHYSIWRKDIAELANLQLNYNELKMFTYQWDSVTSVPALQDSFYHTKIPTLADSTMKNGVYWSTFFVRAHTEDTFIYWDSPVDSGYSVDNLIPLQPSNIHVDIKVDTVYLSWDDPVDNDFEYFSIYRGSESGFDPKLTVPIDTVSISKFINIIQSFGTYYFRIAAFDSSGNRSHFSEEACVILSAIETKDNSIVPESFKLYQNYPNPFNPETYISFQLPQNEKVKIQIFNQVGQLIRILIDEEISMGYHKILWDAKDFYGESVSNGIYLCKMNTGNFRETIKMLLMK